MILKFKVIVFLTFLSMLLLGCFIYFSSKYSSLDKIGYKLLDQSQLENVVTESRVAIAQQELHRLGYTGVVIKATTTPVHFKEPMQVSFQIMPNNMLERICFKILGLGNPHWYGIGLKYVHYKNF